MGVPAGHCSERGCGEQDDRSHKVLAVERAAGCTNFAGQPLFDADHHFNYFGVNGNLKQLERLAYHARRAWFTWLRRRGHRVRLNWGRFRDLLRAFPLPIPRVVVIIWG